MPRQSRNIVTGRAHHVTNRGNDRRCLFFEDSDYDEFLRLMRMGKQRYNVKVFGVTLMPNHFHGEIQPEEDGALSGYLHWVLGSKASDFRNRTNTVGHGHVFQGRFWSGPINDSSHFLRVLRYIEGNPRHAGLVGRAEDWPWSSIRLRENKDPLLDPLPLPLPDRWLDLVNQPQSNKELKKLRRAGVRGRPWREDGANA